MTSLAATMFPASRETSVDREVDDNLRDLLRSGPATQGTMGVETNLVLPL